MQGNKPAVEFLKPPRSNESERVVCEGPLEMEVVCTDKDQLKSVKSLSEVAPILRSEIVNMDNWCFDGLLGGIDPPQTLASFIKWVSLEDRSIGVANKKETLSVGLSLSIHKQTRNKRFVQLASHLGRSVPYDEIIKNENRMVTSVKK